MHLFLAAVAIGSFFLAAEVEERKRKNTARLGSELRFHTLIDSVRQGILVHRHRRPLYANQALADLYGYDSPDEILALESTRALLSPAHTEAFGGFHEKRLRGEPITGDEELRSISKQGVKF